jgi:hypothetical protein
MRQEQFGATFASTPVLANLIPVLSVFPATLDPQNTSISRIPRGASVSPEFDLRPFWFFSFFMFRCKQES